MGKSIYFYEPSLAASIIFTILYVIPFLYHFYMTVIAPCTGQYSRTGYFIPIVIGAAMEVAAYGVRAASVKKPDNVGLYATSSTLVVIAPVLVCASLYILIGRLIRSSLERHSNDPTAKRLPAPLAGKISSAWIPRIFVISDILSFLTQASGSGIASSNDWQGTSKDAGIGVLIAGLVLQLVTFSIFLILVIWYHIRIIPLSSTDTRSSEARLLLNGMYIAGFFITVRLIYRVVEFSIGIGGYTWTHEWPLYVFEAVPMFVAMVVMGRYHPTSILEDKPTELQSRGKDSEGQPLGRPL
ncbi:uncharacterized protein TRUGW13939_00072 [Talaromyces rugulosus]|uniref:RTA1 domain protein n=1 Tax=Talaromyces rugulosus TaxID=121627 RepID=A0A7H8QHK0_TALRU|nr:uncharacterized protein TRUGW13939_00072 [Talaromyces rugulosus]QKX53001.1 hypothetical protein TRUGW13939_00072 [Talaromyces rugulosus]